MSLFGSRCRWEWVLLAALAAGLVLPVSGQVPKAPVGPKVPVAPGAVVPGKAGPRVPVAPGTVAPNAPKTPVPPAAAGNKNSKLPEPEDIAVETKDNFSIKTTYYASTLKKEAVPFILVHGMDGQRGDMHGLAMYLQKLGHAVIAPDLRGHGQSKTQKRPDGSSVSLDPDKMTRPMLEAMYLDVQACKKYLMEKNNAGELNIEQLCVVGADFGAVVATRWAAYDLSQNDLPAYKLGKDVKALILLSPPASYKGVSLRQALTVPALSSLPMMIVAGADDNAASTEADKLKKQLQTHHSKSEDTDLFVIKPATSVSGAKLLMPNLGVMDKIANFVEKTVASKKAYAWQDRTNPL